MHLKVEQTNYVPWKSTDAYVEALKTQILGSMKTNAHNIIGLGLYLINVTLSQWLQALEENRQRTTLFRTVICVVKDHNDYLYFCYYGRLVTDK